MDGAVGAFDLVVGLAPPAAGGCETVTDLDAFDGLDSHQRTGEPRIESSVPVDVRAEARRQAVHDYFHEHPFVDEDGQPILPELWSFPGRRSVERRLKIGLKALEITSRVFDHLPGERRRADRACRRGSQSTGRPCH